MSKKNLIESQASLIEGIPQVGKPVRIVGIDPGGTTGFVLVEIDWEKEKLVVVESQQLGPHPHHDELYEVLTLANPEVIVCESFEYRNVARAGLVLDSVEYIGVTKLYEQVYSEGGVQLVFQTAALGKVQHGRGLVKPDNIRKLGLWSVSSVHAIDALGHVLYYLITKYKSEPLVLQLLEKGWR